MIEPAGGLLLAASPDDVARAGEVVVCLDPGSPESGRLGEHALLMPAQPSPGGEGLRLLVGVRHHERVARGQVATDQVAATRSVWSSPKESAWSPCGPRTRANAVLGSPTYATCRVQPADLRGVERPVCLVDGLTLSLLGIAPGDRVVAEGFPDPAGRRARSVRLRAHEAPASVVELRTTLSGGTFEARFPVARDALGVYPELPWIFLDASTRAARSVAGKLGTIRVRASRRHQLPQEMRELLLLAHLLLSAWARRCRTHRSPSPLRPARWSCSA